MIIIIYFYLSIILDFGMQVLVMPLGDMATVRSIECNSQPCTIARAGENVAVVLQGIDASHVIAGGVLCHPDFPVRVASHLELKILVLDVKVPILIGSQVRIHCRLCNFRMPKM